MLSKYKKESIECCCRGASTYNLVYPIYVYMINNMYIYIHIAARDLPLRDMISLGAWRMGLGCSGEILPSPPPSSPTRVLKGASYQFHYNFGASGMRGSIRLVFRVPTDRIRRKVVVGKPQVFKHTLKNIKNGKQRPT